MAALAVPALGSRSLRGLLATIGGVAGPPTDARGPALTQIEQLRRRDPDAWHAFFVDAMPPIYQYVQSRLGSTSESEDVTSEVFEQAWRAIDTLEERGVPPRAWLFGIARNIVGTHRRRWFRRPPQVALQVYDGPVAELPLTADQLDLARAISRLSRAHAEVISLRFIHGLSLAEVAEVLGASTDAIKGRQARALAALRYDLEGGA